ncbi:MAG: ABC transporter ATP-binding protein [Acidobacteriia bacterium]|nr:ABC transporter ATP-binding protein [Terriglobia bacterium]
MFRDKIPPTSAFQSLVASLDFMDSSLLQVSDLHSVFHVAGGRLRAVDGVSFEIPSRGTLGIVGESGCGKTVTALSILRLLQPPAEIESGSVLFRARNNAGSKKKGPGESEDRPALDLLKISERRMRRIRGAEISMVFQEPASALNPVLNAGDQIAEAVRAHEKVSRKESWDRAVAMMEAVSIPDAARRAKEYPHQLSGGLRQRVMIAMALVCRPQLLIADEPTTALDVTVQAQILELLQSMCGQYDLSMLFISHDLGVIAAVADEVAVMYCGKIVEHAPVEELFANPRHPYTQGLLRSLPTVTLGEMPTRKLEAIPGSVPNLMNLSVGCKFEPRCAVRLEECKTFDPPLYPLGKNHSTRCVLCRPT